MDAQMKITGLRIRRSMAFPFGKTSLRMNMETEYDDIIEIDGLAEVLAAPHEKFVRLTFMGVAHRTIVYLLTRNIGPACLPEAEHHILGASFRHRGSENTASVRADPGTTLSATFEPGQVILHTNEHGILSEVRRFEIDGFCALKLETLVLPTSILPALVPTEIIVPQPKVFEANAAAPQSASRCDFRAWFGLRDWQNALLEILAGLCGSDDRRTARARSKYHPRRSRG